MAKSKVESSQGLELELVEGSESEAIASFPKKWNWDDNGEMQNVMFCGFQTVSKEKSGEDRDYQVAIFKSLNDEERYSTSAGVLLREELNKVTDMCATVYLSIKVVGSIPSPRKGFSATKVFSFKKALLKKPVDPRWLMY